MLVRELERTRAFDRKVLVIVPTTGTGWINPVAARALEMMYNGDTAMVGSQYSYLPSWISFLGDREKSMESGRMMIDAIHDRWAQLPPDRRPKLVLYGESLGSMAGQGAFGWLPDIARMGFSSVLWVGPPNASPLWRGLIARRDPGTPEVEPRYDNGRTVRFSQATDTAEIVRDTAGAVGGHAGAVPAACVGPHRLVVGGSVVHPAGLAEGATGPRPHAGRCAGIPIVTFWQVAADMTNAGFGARRTRPQLRRLRARRLGGRRAARRLDRTGHRTHPAARWRRPRPTTGPSIDARQQDSSITGAGAGGGAGRLERTGRPAGASARPIR